MVVFFVHHTQQLAAAAQVGDAKGIRKNITEMKMRLIKVALKAISPTVVAIMVAIRRPGGGLHQGATRKRFAARPGG